MARGNAAAIDDYGSGFATVDGKRIDYRDIGGVNDPMSNRGGVSSVPPIGLANPIDQTAVKQAQPIGADSGSGFAVVDGRRVNYSDIGTSRDPLSSGGGVSVIPSIADENGRRPVSPIADFGGGGVLQKSLQSAGGAVRRIDDMGNGSAMVDGKRINYSDIGTSRDPLAGMGSLSTIPSIESSLPANQPAGGARTVPDIGADIAPREMGNVTVPPIGGKVYNPVHELPGVTIGPDKATEAVRAKLGFLPDDYYKNPVKYQRLLAESAVDLTGQARMTEAANQGEYQRGVLAIDAPYKRGLIANEQDKITMDRPLTEARTKNVQSETRYRNFLMTPEGAASAESGELPPEARMVNFLVGNGIARDRKQAWDMLKTSKSDPVHTVSNLVQSMETQQEKQGIGSTDPRYKSRDNMVNDAMALIGHVQGRMNGNEESGQSAASGRDVSPLMDYIRRNSHRPMNELIASAQRQGWSDEEIRSAQRPAEAKARGAASPGRQGGMKATRNGNSISYQGQSYQIGADGTVVIGGRKYQVQ